MDTARAGSENTDVLMVLQSMAVNMMHTVVLNFLTLNQKQ